VCRDLQAPARCARQRRPASCWLWLWPRRSRRRQRRDRRPGPCARTAPARAAQGACATTGQSACSAAGVGQPAHGPRADGRTGVRSKPHLRDRQRCAVRRRTAKADGCGVRAKAARCCRPTNTIDSMQRKHAGGEPAPRAAPPCARDYGRAARPAARRAPRPAQRSPARRPRPRARQLHALPPAMLPAGAAPRSFSAAPHCFARWLAWGGGPGRARAGGGASPARALARSCSCLPASQPAVAAAAGRWGIRLARLPAACCLWGTKTSPSLIWHAACKDHAWTLQAAQFHGSRARHC